MSESKAKKQVLFVQGGGEGAHDQWDDKLVASLERELGPDYDVLYPLMPNEAEPSYARWKSALNSVFAQLEDGAILVAHSIGATILIQVLADKPSKRKFGGLFLVAAPFVGNGGWPSDDINPVTDLGAKLPEMPIYFYHGTKDTTAPVAHVALYAQAVPQATVRRLKGRDHQLNNDLGAVARDIRSLA